MFVKAALDFQNMRNYRISLRYYIIGIGCRSFTESDTPTSASWVGPSQSAL